MAQLDALDKEVGHCMCSDKERIEIGRGLNKMASIDICRPLGNCLFKMALKLLKGSASANGDAELVILDHQFAVEDNRMLVVFACYLRTYSLSYAITSLIVATEEAVEVSTLPMLGLWIVASDGKSLQYIGCYVVLMELLG